MVDYYIVVDCALPGSPSPRIYALVQSVPLTSSLALAMCLTLAKETSRRHDTTAALISACALDLSSWKVPS